MVEAFGESELAALYRVKIALLHTSAGMLSEEAKRKGLGFQGLQQSEPPASPSVSMKAIVVEWEGTTLTGSPGSYDRGLVSNLSSHLWSAVLRVIYAHYSMNGQSELPFLVCRSNAVPPSPASMDLEEAC